MKGNPPSIKNPLWVFILLACLFFIGAIKPAHAARLRMISKWGLFELTARSGVNYSDPLSDVIVTAEFISPVGDVFKVNGFWDNGRYWTIRFSPDMPGRWKYKTTCSDATNRSLNLNGEFLCIASTAHSPFDLHGPVQLARDHRHLEHEDHTPFFWLADSVWNGVDVSTADELNFYAVNRARQKFNAAQWAAIYNLNRDRNAPFVTLQPLKLNPIFFKKLDAKIESLNRAGLLNVIVPLSELPIQGNTAIKDLPDDQAVSLLRYMVARWNADKIVWVITCSGSDVQRWKQIAREVFGNISHAPIMIFTGDDYWALKEFRDESWVDLFGYQSGQEISEEAQEWLFAGPITTDWQASPARPYINILQPYENEQIGRSRVSPAGLRNSAYWNLLATPTAGVTYGGQGVWDWKVKWGEHSGATSYQYWATWQKAMFLPAAKQMEFLSAFFNSIDFGLLRPAQELIVRQPGTGSPTRHISAASSTNRDLSVIYIPDGGTVELNGKYLPRSAAAFWFNPRTGVKMPASLDASRTTVKFSNPETGDWLLLITASRR